MKLIRNKKSEVIGLQTKRKIYRVRKHSIIYNIIQYTPIILSSILFVIFVILWALIAGVN